VTLQASDGLIELSEYAASTTAGAGTAGDVKNWLKYRKIKKGSSGTPVVLKEFKYAGDDQAGGPKVYQPASEIDYLGPSDTIETSYAYEYHSGTLAVLQRTTAFPVIPADQNGPGGATGAQRVERFDIRGNLTWSKDERGFITRNI